MNADDVVDLLLEVDDAPPPSRRAANELEEKLSTLTDVPAIDDFLVSLSMYEPTDTPDPQLLGHDELRAAAFDALHELGRHDRCLHHVPLAERP